MLSYQIQKRSHGKLPEDLTLNFLRTRNPLKRKMRRSRA